MPESETQVRLDSFIVVNGVLYIFQFTIALNHAFNPLLDLPMQDWGFVFVIPPGSILTCPQLRPDREWGLFSAELSVDATTPLLRRVQPQRDLRVTNTRWIAAKGARNPL